MSAKVALRAERSAAEILISVVNKGAEPITVVNHPRYLTLELEDETHLFVRGVLQPEISVPPLTAASYIQVAPKSTASGVFRLALARSDDGGCSVGALRFSRIPKATQLRAVYKAEMVMPNLPKALERSFFRGPAESAPLQLAFE